MGKFWGQIANLADCELLAKIFLGNMHKIYLAYALTVAYLLHFPRQ